MAHIGNRHRNSSQGKAGNLAGQLPRKKICWLTGTECCRSRPGRPDLVDMRAKLPCTEPHAKSAYSAVWSISQAPAALRRLLAGEHSVTRADSLRLALRSTAGTGTGPASPVPARPGG